MRQGTSPGATQRVASKHKGGFLGDVLPNTLGYDAHSIGESSGGPVLDRQGRVIGINDAYLSGFRAINYGIPIRFGHELLQGCGLEPSGPTRETPEVTIAAEING